MSKEIRWGIIGVGNVTEVKSGPGFRKVERSRLVAVMRRDPDLARDYAQRHGVPRWYDDAQALISDPEVDAVYIATPPSSHAAYTLMAAEQGKAVYVEKPMAVNHAECRAMIEACQEAGVALYVAYYRRALPRFLKIKELLQSGAIGEVRYVAITLTMPPRPDELDPQALPWRVIPSIAGGGRFVDLASHQLDFLDYVLGPISEARGFAANQGGLYPAEDVVSAAFSFASGIQAVGAWCFTAFEERDHTEIVGTQGKISYATFEPTPIRLAIAEGPQEFAIADPAHVQQPLIQAVVDDLLGQGQCPSTGESAARTTWVMDQILANYY